MPASIIPCVPLGNTIKYSQYSLYTPNMTYTEMKHLRYFRPEALKKLRVLTGGVSGSDTAHTASTCSMLLFNAATTASILAEVRIMYVNTA